MSPFHLRLFGPFALSGPTTTPEASRAALTLRSSRQRELVAYLALQPDLRSARQAVSFALWPETFEAQARNNLRNLIHAIRHGSHAEALSALIKDDDGGGLALAGTTWIDVRTFQDHVTEAERALERDDFAGERRWREEAAGLSSGRLLEDLDAPWLDEHRARLRRLVKGNQLRLLDAYLRVGKYRLALALATQLLEEDPLHEEACRGQMSSHLALGDRAGALLAYHRLAHALDAELGVAPGESTQVLFAEIRAAEALRAMRQAPANPYRRFPRFASSFVGRREELQSLRQALVRHRLVTLTGPGGVGKTRLGAVFAAQSQREADRAPKEAAEADPARSPSTSGDLLWLDVGALVDEGDLCRAVMAALDLESEGPADVEALRASAATQLEGREALLVFDHAERSTEACIEVVEALLEAHPGLRILCLSREVLRLAGERVHRLGGLDCGPGDPPWTAGSDAKAPAPANGAARSEEDGGPALELFLKRAVAAEPSFALDAESSSVATRICRQLDGLPFAIELAAAQVSLLSAEELLTHLDDALGLLGAARPGPGDAQDRVRRTIAWSRSFLTPQEERLLRRLSVFEGSVDLDAITTVCDVGDPSDFLGPLGALVGKSLVERVPSTGPARYRLLGLIRQVGDEELVRTDEASAIRARLVRWAVDFAEEVTTGQQGPAQSERFDLLATHADNLRAALRWSLAGGGARGEDFLRLVVALSGFWTARGLGPEGWRWILRGQDFAAEAPAPLRARYHLAACACAHLVRDTEVERHAHEAKTIAESADLPEVVAFASGFLGLHALRAGDLTQAESHFADAMARHEALGDDWAASHARSYIGHVHLLRGELAEARQVFEQGLEAKAALGDARGAVHIRFNLALTRMREGDIEGAISEFHTCVDQLLSLGDVQTMADAYMQIGCAHRARGDLDRARDSILRAIDIRRRLGLHRDLQLAQALLDEFEDSVSLPDTSFRSS